MAITFAELVKLGIQKESEAEAFYRYWAGKLNDPGGQTLLTELAEEEAKHRVFFENLKESDMRGGQAGEVMDLHMSDYLLSDDISEQSSIQDVLITAIKREAKAIKFYSDLAAQSSNMRSSFEKLAAEEKKHKLRLETYYDDYILTED